MSTGPIIRGAQVTRHGKRWIAWLSLMLLCACAPNIVVDYDKGTDFSRYRTYGWGKGVPAKNPETDLLIVKAVDEQLARKGLTKTDGDPDLVVTYHAATHEEIDVDDASYTAGYDSAAGVPMRVKVGTIVVDMYDTKRKRNIWHGVGSDLVQNDPAKTSMEIQKGAAKMFEKFPPPPK